MARPLEILIVDDDVDVAEGLADVLELSGHRATLIHNGVEAIKTFSSRGFDLVFMDVQMPGMSGVECFLEIRKIDPDVKVIMMTGYDVENSLQRAVNNGAAGVIHKPFPVQIVTEALKLTGTSRFMA